MCKRKTFASVVTCLGAVVGAGFASGQEILQFFSRYGAVSWVGIALSCGVMTGFAAILMNRAQAFQAGSLFELCQNALGKGGRAGQWAFQMLYAVTGGAMLAAAGEIFALIWPWQYGYWIGVLYTLALVLYCVGGSIRPVEAAGVLMLPALLMILILAFSLPQGQEGALMETVPLPKAFSQAIAYGALNITLAAAVLMETGRELNCRCRCRAVVWLGVSLAALLCLGNGALLRHPEAHHQALPFVQLLRPFGRLGYYLGAAGLYLAVLTTLLAAARGMTGLVRESFPKIPAAAITGAAMLLLSLGGFSGLVEKAYPILGYVCLGILLWIAASPKKEKASRG